MIAGRYEVGELLGRGGMAEVRAGWDKRLERPVAIKLLGAERSGQSDLRRRFEAEARTAARLAHPHVVSVFDSGEEAGVLYIVMERLSGRTLRDVLAASPLDAPGVRRLALQMLGALEAAEAVHVVHRDVKPANILMAESGDWKLGDFGIAKGLAVATDQTAAGLVVGTPAYLAPERFYGAPATATGDLYSLGVVLYQAATGRKPVEAARAEEWPYAAAASPPVPIAQLQPQLDAGLAGAIDRSLAKEPAMRYQSAREMAADLSAPDPGVTVPLPAGFEGPGDTEVLPWGELAVAGGAPGRPGRRTRLRKRTGIAGLVALLVVTLVIVGFTTHGGSGGNASTHHPPTTTGTVPVSTTTPVAATTVPTTVPPTTAARPTPPQPAHVHHGHDQSGPGGSQGKDNGGG